jgi:hypothetical protein
MVWEIIENTLDLAGNQLVKVRVDESNAIIFTFAPKTDSKQITAGINNYFLNDTTSRSIELANIQQEIILQEANRIRIDNYDNVVSQLNTANANLASSVEARTALEKDLELLKLENEELRKKLEECERRR